MLSVKELGPSSVSVVIAWALKHLVASRLELFVKLCLCLFDRFAKSEKKLFIFQFFGMSPFMSNIYFEVLMKITYPIT